MLLQLRDNQTMDNSSPPLPHRTIGKKHDWDKLKAEYLAGDIHTVKEFLTKKGISLSNTPQTTGWSLERAKAREDAITMATQKAIQRDASNIFETRQRQANLARYMQLKASEKMKTLDVTNMEDARKLMVSGMEQERRALGMEGGGSQNLTQINIGPKTNVDKMIEGLDYEGLLGLIAELRRERSRKLGKSSAPIGAGEILEGETS